MSNLINFNGKKAELVATTRGWSTIRIDGVEQKVRGSKLVAWVEPVATAAKPKRESGAVSKSVIRLEYKRALRKKHDGVVTNDVGDAVAIKLRKANGNLDALYAMVAEETGLTKSDLRSRYSHMNPGMQRMNLGNVLRGAAKKARAKSA